MTTLPTASRSKIRMEPVAQRARQLRLLFEMEKQYALSVCTVIYRVGEPELKYHLCEHAFEAIQHARFLRDRGRELPGFGKHDDVRPEMQRLFATAVEIEDGLEALACFYRVIKPHMYKAYESYLADANHLGDWPTTRLAEEFIKDEERHRSEMERVLAGIPSSLAEERLREEAETFAKRFAEPGTSAGVAAPAEKYVARPLNIPLRPVRAPYPTASGGFGDSGDEFPIVPDVLSDPNTNAQVIRAMIYVWLYLELDAVDYLATVPYATPEMPFEFHMDVIRHLWDESRHSQFGFRQLPRLGFDLNQIEQQIQLYEVLVRMRPHERYVMMTQHFEAGSFDLKAKIMDRVAELGDFEADTLLAYDRNDEQHHVRYGTRWVPTLMECYKVEGEPRSWLEQCRAKYAAIAATLEDFHDLPVEQRLTATKLLKQFGSGTAVSSS